MSTNLETVPVTNADVIRIKGDTVGESTGVFTLNFNILASDCEVIGNCSLTKRVSIFV